METSADFYGSFTILPSSEDAEGELKALESLGDCIREDYNYWRIDDYDLEPRSAASETDSDVVFEELVKVVQILEEMGWQPYGRIIRCADDVNLQDIDLYLISPEDGEVRRKRGYFEELD